MLNREHSGGAEPSDQTESVHVQRPSRVSGPGPLWGGVLGAVLLGWCVLMAIAPELGSLLAVFGSPVLAFFVILRLLTPDGSGKGPVARR